MANEMHALNRCAPNACSTQSGVAAATVVLAAVLIGVSPVAAQTTPKPSGAQIEIAYVQPLNPIYRPIHDRLQQRKVLEILQEFLAPLNLPRTLLVKVNECGSSSARYKPQGPVTICYEYIEQIRRLAPRSTVQLVQGRISADSAIVGPFVQAVLREVAIATFDMFDVPVWGRLDDAADRVAAFIMLQFGPAVAWYTIVGSAWFLSASTGTSADYSDVRGLVAQRYYTTLCVALGSEQRQEFERFVGKEAAGNLPEDRAQVCPEEYDALKQGFNATLTPHIDKQKLARVRSVNWLKVLTAERN